MLAQPCNSATQRLEEPPSPEFEGKSQYIFTSRPGKLGNFFKQLISKFFVFNDLSSLIFNEKFSPVLIDEMMILSSSRTLKLTLAYRSIAAFMHFPRSLTNQSVTSLPPPAKDILVGARR